MKISDIKKNNYKYFFIKYNIYVDIVYYKNLILKYYNR